MISGFFGKYRFLSNFYECPVCYKGVMFRNSEAAFQAAKDEDQSHDSLLKFATLSPSQAKSLGRRITMRPDWEKVKVGIMYEILWDKFHRNPVLGEWLMQTYPEVLAERNTWCDNIWGDCTCVKCVNILGKNRLGLLLMAVRDRMIAEK